MATSFNSRLSTAPEEGCKAPCVTVSLTNITLSGEQTIGVTAVMAGDRVLVAGQTDSAENGIWVCNTSSWTRAKDWNTAEDVVPGMLIPVSATEELYQTKPFTGAYNPGVTEITFGVGILSARSVETQTGSQAVSGLFTLTTTTYTPGANNLEVDHNGQRLNITTDYTEPSASTVQIVTARVINPDDIFTFRTNSTVSNSVTTTTAITHTRGGVAHNLATYLDGNVMEFDTMADAIASTKVYEGAVLLIKDRANSHWDVVLSSGVTEDGYRIVQGVGVATLSYQLRIDGINTAYKMGVVLDGDKAGGGTDNAGALQAFLTYVRDNGGSHVHLLPGCMRSDTQLTLLSNSTTRRSYLVDFGGAFLDYQSCVSTSGDLFALGATSQANAHDNEVDNFKNLIIIGNETSITTSPVTTCVGLSLEYALRMRLENVFVQNCYEGIKTNFVFDLQADNVCVTNNVIGLRIDDDSTYAQWNNFQAVNNVYGRVIKPGTSGKICANQTFVNPRIEGNDVGTAIDGGTNASFGVRNIADVGNVYAEGNTYDLYREGLQWTLANPATRNAASVGYVVNTRIHGGDWSGMTWSGTCAAIVWPASIGTVLGGEYRIPAAITNCVNYPGKATYQQLIDLTSGLGQNINPTSMPGYGVVVIRGSDGLMTINNNLVSATARTGTGVYTITMRETMTGSTDYAVAATCDDGYVEVDTAACTTTLITLNCFSNAGVAIDPARVRVMIHGVLT